MDTLANSRFEFLPVDKVELDVSNPRIAKWLEMYGDNITPEQMALALGAGDSQQSDGGTTFRSLKESIKTNGGVIHPIIVNEKQSGRLVVIEGNTRTLIYREFHGQGLEGHWGKIPSLVFSGLSEDMIDAIRLQAHLVGPRAWDPYSKAKYLDLLRNKQHLTIDQIVDFCGGQKREVLDYIDAYHSMEKYYRPILDSDQDFDPARFSAFVELQRRRVKETLLQTRFTEKDFATWVRDRKIYPLNTVRQLPRILENDKSKAVFLSQGAQEAIKVLDVPSSEAALADATIVQLARELYKRINSIAWTEVQSLKSNQAQTDKEILLDARDALKDLCDDVLSDG